MKIARFLLAAKDGDKVMAARSLCSCFLLLYLRFVDSMLVKNSKALLSLSARRLLPNNVTKTVSILVPAAKVRRELRKDVDSFSVAALGGKHDRSVAVRALRVDR
jgi:hypothetical protein